MPAATDGVPADGGDVKGEPPAWVQAVYDEVKTWPVPAIGAGEYADMVTGLAHVASVGTARHFTLDRGAIPAQPLRDIDGECFETWRPRTCRSTATSTAARWRSPIDHVCRVPRATPHVCFCSRCGEVGP